MSKYQNRELRSIAHFNPPEKIKDGQIAKKIPMAQIRAYQRKIDGFEIAEYKSGPKFRNGDVLVAKITPCLENGKTAFVDILGEDELAFGSSEFIVLRAKNNTDNIFLYYLARSPAFRKKAIGCMEGTSGRKRVNEGVLKLYELPIPEKLTQTKIANVLSALDAKIELNNRINTELAAMAKIIYDYWFVQFDFPDANGKPYKTSGGKMTYNSTLKYEIPVDWVCETLLNIATFTNGLACQKFRPKNEQYYKVIKIREMGEGFTENSELVTVNIPEKVIVNNGDILFSWSATLDIKIWTGGKGALNQHIFKITSKKYPKSFYYFQLLNYLQHFKMIAELRKTTMGHITQEHLQQSRIVIPPVNLIAQLDEVIKPILDEKVKLEEESQQLSQLRDWLLPMLMNGQVKVQ